MKAVSSEEIIRRIEARIRYLENAINREINDIVEGDMTNLIQLKAAQKQYYLYCGGKAELEKLRDDIESPAPLN
jgi:hypothetical protein